MMRDYILAAFPRPGRPMRRAVRAVRALTLAAVSLLAPLAAAAVQDEARDATEMVRDTTDQVLELIETARSYAEEDPERFYREVEALLSPVIDFDAFARSVMAVHYRDANQEQRERFSERFKWGLVRTYAMALLEFKNGEVVVVPPDRPARNPDRQTVKMEIRTAQGEVYPVLYSVTRNDDGEWKVRNLIVNGVNMGLTYRNQFNSAMRDPRYDGDMDKVIDAWSELLKSEAPGIDDEEAPAQEARRAPAGARDGAGVGELAA